MLNTVADSGSRAVPGNGTPVYSRDIAELDDAIEGPANLVIAGWLIVFSELLHMASDSWSGFSQLRLILSLHAAQIGIAVVGIAIYRNPRFRSCWKPIAFFQVCLLLWTTSWVAMLHHSLATSFFALLLLSTGGATFVPWGPRYQALVNGIGFLAFSFVSLNLGWGPESSDCWAGLVVGFALSQAISLSVTRYRRNLARNMQALRGAEGHLRAIVEAEPDCVKVLSPEGNVLEINQAGLQIAEVDDASEVLGKPLFPMIIPEHRERLLESHQRIQSGESQSERIEFEVVGMKGTRRWLESRAVPLPLEDGKRAILEICRDITDRKATEKERSLLASLVHSAQEAIFSVGLDGKITSWNPGAEHLTGYSAAEIIGKSGWVFAPTGGREEVSPILEKFMRDRQSVHYEARRVRKDGSLIDVALTLSHMFNQSGESIGVSVIASDISARKQAEHELIKAREQALMASVAKSEFLANMSHEIRTPMNAIMGITEVLADTPLSEEQRNYVNICTANSEALLSLINDILDLSKIEAGQLELEERAFDLNELIQKTVETLELRARKKGLYLTWEVGRDVQNALKGDALRFRQVLLNLIGNAIKFTDKGGIAVRVDRDPEGAAVSHLRICVADTGIGVPPEKHQAIFFSFTQVDTSTSRKYGGTGLGLAISRQIVEKMGGRIWVESQVGCGSSFYFTARLNEVSTPKTVQTDGATAGEEQSSATQPQTPHRPIRVLIAEDSEDNRLLLQAFLKDKRFSLDTAGNGAIAFDKFKASSYDIVLMDMQMPVMDGYEAVQAIREWEKREGRAATPIIALTAHALMQQVARSLEAGCNKHVTKPVKKSILIDTIERAVRGHLEGEKMQPQPTRSEGPAQPVIVHVDPELSDIVPTFLRRKREALEEILAALEKADYETVRRHAHRMKGEGSSFGFDPISELGAEMERSCEGRDAAAIRASAGMLVSYLSRVEVVYDAVNPVEAAWATSRASD